MNLFRLIDDFLFDHVYQPLVNRFPFAGPGGVARVFLISSAAALVVMLATDPPYRPSSLIYDAIVYIGLYFAVDLPPAQLGMRNPKRIERFELFCRFVFMILFTGGVLGLLFDYALDHAAAVVSWLFSASYFYARACDKLPPARSRSSWFASLFAGASMTARESQHRTQAG